MIFRIVSVVLAGVSVVVSVVSVEDSVVVSVVSLMFLSSFRLAKTEHSHPLGMVVSTHFRCGKGVKRGLKNGALPFNID